MKILYRPEIDGLRAIAVCAVILYHAQITIFGHQPFSGGFVGVDIFFVISGYLITSIILKELVTTGAFSFKHFYERRVRRILPALLFVMLVSLPFAWMYLLPSSFIDFSKSILYSLGFSSNFYFHYSGQQYGAESGLLKPFLHTWSLSVEEQYYILFPIVLLITFKYFKKHLLTILVIGLIISLQMADWGSKNYPSASFYFLHTRMWELLAGSILAYFEITNGKRSENKTLNLILPTIGLLLIGHSILFFNDKMLHPSFYTLSPIIGVCLIIWFSNKDEITTKILSTKLFVGVGLISYSLYLWHYPIFAFCRLHFDNIDEITKVFLIIIIFTISSLSFFFIEQPFRNKRLNLSIIFSKFSLIIIILIFFLNINLNFLLPEPLKNISYINLNKKSYFDKQAKNKERNIFLIGDSHANSLSVELFEKTKKDFNFYLFQNSCPFLLNLISTDSKMIKKSCKNNYQKKILKKINERENSIIILASSFPNYIEGTNYKSFFKKTKYDNPYQLYLNYNDKVFLNKKQRISSVKKELKQTIDEITIYNNKVILVYPYPQFKRNVISVLKNLSISSKSLLLQNRYSSSYTSYKEFTKNTFNIFDSIDNPAVYQFYPHKYFCDKNECYSHDKKGVFYRDSNHPSVYGEKILVSELMKIINQIK